MGVYEKEGVCYMSQGNLQMLDPEYEVEFVEAVMKAAAVTNIYTMHGFRIERLFHVKIRIEAEALSDEEAEVYWAGNSERPCQ